MSVFKDRRVLSKQLTEAINEIRKLQEQNRSLLKQLYTDDLTGIGNRRAFDEKFPILVDTAHRSNEPLALLVADVDGLKRTNDALGHLKGDALLRAVAKALEQASRNTDFVGRFGGDEYYAVLPGFCPLPGQDQDELFNQTIERYRACFNHFIGKLDFPKKLSLDVSFGLTLLQAGEAADNFYNRTDKICQANKNRVYENLKKQGVEFEDKRRTS